MTRPLICRCGELMPEGADRDVWMLRHWQCRLLDAPPAARLVARQHLGIGDAMADTMAQLAAGFRRVGEAMQDMFGKPGTVSHLQFMLQLSLPRAEVQVLDHQLCPDVPPLTVEVYVRLRWWVLLTLGVMHVVAHRRAVRVLQQHSAAGVTSVVHVGVRRPRRSPLHSGTAAQ